LGLGGGKGFGDRRRPRIVGGHHADLAGGAGEAGQALAREVVEGG
jgi:hypothetical protein